jgi:hypothetical protein
MVVVLFPRISVEFLATLIGFWGSISGWGKYGKSR